MQDIDPFLFKHTIEIIAKNVKLFMSSLGTDLRNGIATQLTQRKRWREKGKVA
jgi:hypothetical protein